MRCHLVPEHPGLTARLLYRRIRAYRTARRMVVAGALLSGLAVLPACGSMRIGETADPIVTGSIKPQPVALQVTGGDAPDGVSPGDWTQAKLALEQALASPDKAASIPWDNPGTGARGTATPIGAAGADGCRDFRIGLVNTAGEQWVQGSACKDSRGMVNLTQVRLLGRA